MDFVFKNKFFTLLNVSIYQIDIFQFHHGLPRKVFKEILCIKEIFHFQFFKIFEWLLFKKNPEVFLVHSVWWEIKAPPFRAVKLRQETQMLLCKFSIVRNINDLKPVQVLPDQMSDSQISKVVFGCFLIQIYTSEDFWGEACSILWPIDSSNRQSRSFSLSTSFPGKEGRGLWSMEAVLSPGPIDSDSVSWGKTFCAPTSTGKAYCWTVSCKRPSVGKRSDLKNSQKIYRCSETKNFRDQCFKAAEWDCLWWSMSRKHSDW